MSRFMKETISETYGSSQGLQEFKGAKAKLESLLYTLNRITEEGNDNQERGPSPAARRDTDAPGGMQGDK